MRPRSVVRAAAIVVILSGCAPPRMVDVVTPVANTAEDAAAAFNAQLVELRTMVGRGGISVEARGFEDTLVTSRCATHRPGCVRCDLAGEANPRERGMIAAITGAFARYPTSVLSAAGIEHVALCKHIVNNIEPVDPAGIADLEGHRMLIGFDEPDRAETIVHHELYHLLEWNRTPDIVTDDPEWDLLNPLGFNYFARAPHAKRELGFVDPYAMTAATEDRASVFEYLMTEPDALCTIAVADPVVRAKVRLIWDRVAKIDGDRFLHERAPCVDDWIDAPVELLAPLPSRDSGQMLRPPQR